mgnify:CR=1 FL=1
MKRITSVSLLALALAGCVNMAPDHTRPALPSAAAYDPAFAPDGTVLRGLFAAGEVCGFGGGGYHGYNALEGTFLGGCLFSGRIAGQNA